MNPVIRTLNPVTPCNPAGKRGLPRIVLVAIALTFALIGTAQARFQGEAGSALALLDRDNPQPEKAEELILHFCNNYPDYTRPHVLYRLALLGRIRQRLTPASLTAIEDYAWGVLTKYTMGTSRGSANQRFPWLGANKPINQARRYMLALRIVGLSDRYGWDAILDGETVESNYQAWIACFQRHLRLRAMHGVDTEINTKSAYLMTSLAVYYDLYDLSGSEALRKLAGNYLDLYWAELAAEYEPRTGMRALAGVRKSAPWSNYNYLDGLLGTYGWHDREPWFKTCHETRTFRSSSYRPPKILAAIAGDLERGEYLATSRRPGAPDDEANGDDDLRRDVYYTPDYTLSTLSHDPAREYPDHTILLAQLMGVTFAESPHSPPGNVDVIAVKGNGYPRRAINGVTDRAVSIIARDFNEYRGQGTFASNDTLVFIRDGKLWENRVEDESGWFFTRRGNAYVALRPAAGGYTAKKAGRGHNLVLNDKWAPIIIQMGRAKDYESFDAFQASVKDNPLTYEPLPQKDGAGKMTYVSEAGERFEYWANSKKLPHINGKELNLNPRKTYDSPFLSMVHGQETATISHPGYDDVVLDFAPRWDGMVTTLHSRRDDNALVISGQVETYGTKDEATNWLSAAWQKLTGQKERRQLEFRVDGKQVGSQSLQLAPNQPVKVDFSHSFDQYPKGVHMLTAAIDGNISHAWKMLIPNEEMELSKGWKVRTEQEPEWIQPVFDDSGWQTVDLPHAAHRGPSKFYYRKQLVIPEHYRGAALTIDLGEAGKVAEVFFNGRSIGKIITDRGDGAHIPNDLIRYGKPNIIAVYVSGWGRPLGLVKGPYKIFPVLDVTSKQGVKEKF